MTDMSRLVVAVDASDVDRANSKLNTLRATARNTGRSVDTFSSSFSGAGNKIQNAAFQIQDFAVQVGSGQSAMRAFAQQAPQFLGAFGVGGAIAGGVVAVAAAISGPLVESLFESEDATSDLEEALETLDDTITKSKRGVIGLSEEFEILAERSRDVAEVQLQSRLITAADAANQAFKLLAEEIQPLNKSFDDSGRNARLAARNYERAAESLGITKQEYFELKEAAQEALQSRDLESVKSLQSLMNDLALANRGVSDEFLTMASKVNDSVFAFEDQIDTAEFLEEVLGDVDGAIQKYGESTVKAAEEQSKVLAKLEEDIERLEDAAERQSIRREARAIREAEERKKQEEREAEQAARRLQQEEAAARRRVMLEAQANNSIFQARAEFGSQMAQLLAQNAEEGSTVAKVAYALEQGIAVAQAINNANLAYTYALAGPLASINPPAALVQAEALRTVGYASAAMIAGNAVGTLAARAQGGQVLPGESYRVGEFGPEVITMGSNGGTVSPMAMNDGVKLEVYNNVKVMGGQAEVTTNTRQVNDKKFVTDIVVSLANNKQSGMMQGIFRNTTAEPKGVR